MLFDNNEQLKICNVMTADNCQNIDAALQYVSENSKSLSTKGISQVQRYVAEQVEQWAKKSNGRLTEQDVMFGLIRSNMVLRAEGDDVRPVDMRYAVEHPMRISQMRYGVRSGDNDALCRLRFLVDMLFNADGKPIYETQRFFLSALADKLIQDGRGDNELENAMAGVLLTGMKRSVTSDAWGTFSPNIAPEALCFLGAEQEMMPRVVIANHPKVNVLKRERN